MKNLPSYGLIRPFGKRKQIQIFLAGLEHDLDVCPPEIFREKLLWRQIAIRDQNKIAILYGHPVFVLQLHISKLLLMLTKVIAEALQGIVLVHIDVGVLTMIKKFDFLTESKVSMMLPDKCIFTAVYQVLNFPVQGFVRISPAGRHSSDDGFFGTDMKGFYQLF